MEYRAVDRTSESFQRTVTPDQVRATCRRAFGPQTEVLSAVELSGGTYNTTFRVDLSDHGPVVLRVAPSAAQQNRVERDLMRNEHASLPYLAPISELLPWTLAVDFTHQVLDRDYVIQSYLPGRQAAGCWAALSDGQREQVWFQIGGVLARVHSVVGTGFGRVAATSAARWSDVVVAAFDRVVADLDDRWLDSADLVEVAQIARAHAWVLDEIREPRLLHGDLSPVNVMLSAEGARVTGVFDCDRTSWGDPMADWTMFAVCAAEPVQRAAFWRGYGTEPADHTHDHARALLYRALHLGSVRLEQHRLQRPIGVERSRKAMAKVLHALRI